jgi:hypothetical protein
LSGRKVSWGAVGGAAVGGCVSGLLFDGAFTLIRPLWSTGSLAKSVAFGPHNVGPLSSDVANTFRTASYSQVRLSESTVLHRAYGGKAGPLGSYWTRARPTGPLQSQIDSALNPVWGNTATNVSSVRVPAGTTIFEGSAAPQDILGGSLMGGGNQIYITRVEASWLVP